jgi:hypothetical protein
MRERSEGEKKEVEMKKKLRRKKRRQRGGGGGREEEEEECFLKSQKLDINIPRGEENVFIIYYMKDHDLKLIV